MIPIGATVDITTPPGAPKPNRWRGVVTSHPGPYSIEIDGRLIAPANLAKVVGMTEDFMGHRDADSETARVLHMELTAAVTERDALRELVAAQAMTNAELAQSMTELEGGTNLRVAELEEWVSNAQSYVEDLLLLFMGERRPVRPIEPPELRRLADFVFEGV